MKLYQHWNLLALQWRMGKWA